MIYRRNTTDPSSQGWAAWERRSVVLLAASCADNVDGLTRVSVNINRNLNPSERARSLLSTHARPTLITKSSLP